MSFPEAVAPGATVTVVGGLTAPEVGGGAGGGAGDEGVLEAPLPQPTTNPRIIKTLNRWNNEHRPHCEHFPERCFQQNRCCTCGK